MSIQPGGSFLRPSSLVTRRQERAAVLYVISRPAAARASMRLPGVGLLRQSLRRRQQPVPVTAQKRAIPMGLERGAIVTCVATRVGACPGPNGKVLCALSARTTT